MKTINEWYNTLIDLTQDTDYEVLIKDDIKTPVVAIVPKGYTTPQRIAIYPKKTKDAGLVIEYDILNIPGMKELINKEYRLHSNRPHYNDIPDNVIIGVCKTFLCKA